MDEVRVKRGLTYGIETQLTAFNRAAIMVGSVATRADAVRQTISVVRDTLANFAANGATQQELDDAKTFLTGSFPLAFASNSGIAAQLNTFQRQNLDIGYVAKRNSLIEAVTLADVNRVAKKLYDPARLTVVVAGSPAEGKAPERPQAPVRPTPLPAANPPSGPSTAAAPAGGAPSAAAAPGVKPVVKPAVKPAIVPPKPARSSSQSGP
jgi:zinc protease